MAVHLGLRLDLRRRVSQCEVVPAHTGDGGGDLRLVVGAAALQCCRRAQLGVRQGGPLEADGVQIGAWALVDGDDQLESRRLFPHLQLADLHGEKVTCPIGVTYRVERRPLL